MGRMIAAIDDDVKRRLSHVLLDEGVTFAEWLRHQIEAYLAKNEATKKPPAERADEGDRGR